MSIWLLMLAQAPVDSYMETWVPLCGSVCVFQSPCFWSHTLVRMYTCIGTWIYVHLTTHVCSTPMHSLMETWMLLCGIVCLLQSSSFCSPPCLECVHTSVHEFMSIWLPMSSPPLCIVWWKSGCPCMSVCLCPSHLISVPTTCLDYVHASVHVFMSIWLPMIAQPTVDSYMETLVPLCASVCVCPSQPASGHTPCLEHVHAFVHEFMSTWLPMSAPLLCKIWFKSGCPCVSVCLCPSHLNSVPPSCFQCVHSSVHEFMSTWLPITTLPLCIVWYGSVFVSQSPDFCSHNLYRMYLCLSDFQCHLKPLCIVMWKHWCPCMALCMCRSHLISVPTSCLECVQVSVHAFMSTQLPMLAQHPMDSYMETWVSLCGSVCVAVILLLATHLGSNVYMYMHLYMNLYPPDWPCLLPPCIVWWKSGCPCMSVCLCPSHLISVPTPCLKCVHASVHVFLSIWLPILAWSPLHSYIETWVSQCSTVCV